MTEVAVHAGVSKATLNPLHLPRYPNTTLGDDLVALMEQAGSCDNNSEIFTATREMARSQPDLYRTLSERCSLFIHAELAKLAAQAALLQRSTH